MKKFLFAVMLGLLFTHADAASFRECDIKNEQLKETRNLIGKFQDNKNQKRYSQFANRAVDISLDIIDTCQSYYKKRLNKFYQTVSNSTNQYYKDQAISKEALNAVIAKIDANSK